MYRLKIPAIDSIDLWDSIVRNKDRVKRESLARFRQIIIERYHFYQDHFDALDEIFPLDQSVWNNMSKELQACYGTNVNFLRARKIVLLEIHKCPYCMLNRPNTLDHYFDKVKYPEYSVYIPNLVPCCSECNTSKGSIVFVDNRRKHLHVYHDTIPDSQFLFVNLDFKKDEQVPEIRVFLKFEDNTINSQLIEAHFNSLGLRHKYQHAIADKLSTIIREIEYSRDYGLQLQAIRNSLSIRKKSYAEQYGANYWETAMYEGLLNSSSFIDQVYAHKRHRINIQKI